MAKIFNGMAFHREHTVASVASFLFPCPFCKVLAVQHLGEKLYAGEAYVCNQKNPSTCLREIRKLGEFLLGFFQEASQEMCIFFDGVGECPTEWEMMSSQDRFDEG